MRWGAQVLTHFNRIPSSIMHGFTQRPTIYHGVFTNVIRSESNFDDQLAMVGCCGGRLNDSVLAINPLADILVSLIYFCLRLLFLIYIFKK